MLDNTEYTGCLSLVSVQARGSFVAVDFDSSQSTDQIAVQPAFDSNSVGLGSDIKRVRVPSASKVLVPPSKLRTWLDR